MDVWKEGIGKMEGRKESRKEGVPAATWEKGPRKLRKKGRKFRKEVKEGG